MRHEFYLVFEIQMLIGDPPFRTVSTMKYGTFIIMEDPNMRKSWIKVLEIAMKERFKEVKDFEENGVKDYMVTLLNWKYLGEAEEDRENDEYSLQDYFNNMEDK